MTSSVQTPTYGKYVLAPIFSVLYAMLYTINSFKTSRTRYHGWKWITKLVSKLLPKHLVHQCKFLRWNFFVYSCFISIGFFVNSTQIIFTGPYSCSSGTFLWVFSFLCYLVQPNMTRELEERPVVLRLPRHQLQSLRDKDEKRALVNWRYFFYQFDQDHSKPDLVWNLRVCTTFFSGVGGGVGNVLLIHDFNARCLTFYFYCHASFYDDYLVVLDCNSV